MKVAIFKDMKLQRELQRIGRKTKSHGTYRAKRKPNSPRVRTEIKQGQYHVS